MSQFDLNSKRQVEAMETVNRFDLCILVVLVAAVSVLFLAVVYSGPIFNGANTIYAAPLVIGLLYYLYAKRACVLGKLKKLAKEDDQVGVFAGLSEIKF